jgi:glycosyltransferase involved in cell wall biosynthesis
LKKKGVILSLTELTKDARIFKTARYLADHAIDITVISCHSYPVQSREEYLGNIHLFRITPLGSLFARILGSRRSGPPGDTDTISAGKTLAGEIFGLINAFYFLLVQFRLFLYILPSRYEYCHTNDWDTLLVGYLYSLFRKCIWIHDSHEIYAEQDPDFPESFKKIVSYTESLLFKKATHIITVNESIADYFVKKYAVSRPYVIYNCPVLEDIQVPETGDEGVKIIYVGSFEKNRGLEELIDIAPVLDGTLFFQGFGTMEEYLRGKIIESGLEGKVFFLDPVPVTRIVSSLSWYDIGLLPYKPVCLNNYYSSANKLFEYMMAGLAIVSVDIPEVRRLIGECKNGLLYNPDDPQDFIDKIRVLVNNPDMVRSMKKNSMEYGKTNYYWEKQAEKLLEMY